MVSHTPMSSSSVLSAQGGPRRSDTELLRDIHISPSKQVIVSGLTSIARQLGITVLAEGVEIEAELTVLRAAGIKLFQGYYFAKPAFMSLPTITSSSGKLAVG
ncbi:EAL domain-containing protein (putative c-di-GMP-specific phosphodiesterase class I) [Bradyrhizobium sp. USDA 4449]